MKNYSSIYHKMSNRNKEFDEIQFSEIKNDDIENTAKRWLLKSFPEVDVKDKINVQVITNQRSNEFTCP